MQYVDAVIGVALLFVLGGGLAFAIRTNLKATKNQFHQRASASRGAETRQSIKVGDNK